MLSCLTLGLGFFVSCLTLGLGFYVTVLLLTLGLGLLRPNSDLLFVHAAHSGLLTDLVLELLWARLDTSS